MGEQHGGEGDPATGRAAEDLGLVLQAVGRPLPAAAGHLPDVPLPGKSFLKFLLSKETDLDSFRRTRPIRYSYALDGQKSMPDPPATGS